MAVLAALIGLAASPVFADTKSQLDAAKARLAQVQSELDQANARYQAAFSAWADTRHRIDVTRVEIAAIGERIERIHARLSARARGAYEIGPAGTLDLLLSSDSITEFSDRAEFLGSVVQGDTDLVTAARVSGERLRRAQADLRELLAEQSGTVAELHAAEGEVAAKLAAVQSTVDQLTKKLKAEQRLRIEGIRFRPGAVLVTCPVAGPNTFTDTFGDPRYGGGFHRHQGIDMLAAYGTPVVAAQTGNAVRNPNDLGGLAVLVFATNGDYTYYAHLSSYGATGHVTAGTMIGRVGNTGDAQGGPYHLHFEYHPGGGAAIDPYQYLLAVC